MNGFQVFVVVAVNIYFSQVRACSDVVVRIPQVEFQFSQIPSDRGKYPRGDLANDL